MVQFLRERVRMLRLNARGLRLTGVFSQRFYCTERDVRSQLMTDLKAAMKQKDGVRTIVVKLIRSEIINNDKKTGTDSTPEQIDACLFKMIKAREDMADLFEAQGHTGSAGKERNEVEIIRGYLPRQLTDEELSEAVAEAIASVGAETPKDLGKVMGVLKKSVGSAASAAAISIAVKNQLA